MSELVGIVDPDKSAHRDAINSLELQYTTPLVPNATVNVALSNAIAAAAASGTGIVFVPPGEHLVKQFSVTESLKIVGIEGSSTLRIQNDDTVSLGGIHVDYSGDASSEKTLTALPSIVNYSESTNYSAYRDKTFAIPVNDASDIVAGDWICLYSRTYQHPYLIDTSPASQEYLGESMHVDRVIGNTIYCQNIPYQVDTFLLQSYTTLYVRRFSRKKFSITGVNLIPDTNTKTWITSGKRNPAIQLTGVAKFEVDISIDGSYAAGLLLKTCVDGNIKLKLRNLLNLPNNAAYGYGADVYGMCHSLIFSEILARQCRHTITTNSLDDLTGTTQSSSKWFWIGQPCAVVVSNLLSINGWGNDLDSHQSGRGWVFKNCTSFFPRENSYAVKQASVVNITSPTALTLADSASTSFNEILTSTTGKLSFTSNPSNNATVTINGSVYTFKTTASLAFEVQIGASRAATAANLVTKILANQPTLTASTIEDYIPASTIIGKGIQIRAPGTVIENFTQEGGAASISMDIWTWDHETEVANDPRSRCSITNSSFRLWKGTGKPHISVPGVGITKVIPLMIKNTEFFGGSAILDASSVNDVVAMTFEECVFSASDNGSEMFDIWAGTIFFKGCRFDMRYGTAGIIPIHNRGTSKVILVDCIFDYGNVSGLSTVNYLVKQQSATATLINGGGNRVFNQTGGTTITTLREAAATGSYSTVTALT
jgi:hypothetical protein